MRAMPEKCDLPEKNAFNASIQFQKSSEYKKCRAGGRFGKSLAAKMASQIFGNRL